MEDTIGFTDNMGDYFPPHPLDGEEVGGKYIPTLGIKMLVGLVKMGKKATDDDLLDVGVPHNLSERARVEFRKWVEYTPQFPNPKTTSSAQERSVIQKPQLSLENMIELYRIYSTNTNDQVSIYDTIKGFKSVQCNHIALQEWVQWVLYEPNMNLCQSSK